MHTHYEVNPSPINNQNKITLWNFMKKSENFFSVLFCYIDVCCPSGIFPQSLYPYEEIKNNARLNIANI